MRAFHEVVVICAVLVAAGGVAGAIGIANPRRAVAAEGCAGGQLVGVPETVGDYERPLFLSILLERTRGGLAARGF